MLLHKGCGSLGGVNLFDPVGEVTFYIVEFLYGRDTFSKSQVGQVDRLPSLPIARCSEKPPSSTQPASTITRSIFLLIHHQPSPAGTTVPVPDELNRSKHGHCSRPARIIVYELAGCHTS